MYCSRVDCIYKYIFDIQMVYEKVGVLIGMDIYKMIIWGFLFFVAFVLWCACALASEYDKVTEEQWEDFLRKEEENERTKKNEARVPGEIRK